MQQKYQSFEDSKQLINLDTIFADPLLDVTKLIDSDEIAGEAKRQNEKITQQLLKHPNILEELMEVCLRPKYYNNARLGQVNNQHTNRALQILTSLTDLFVDYLIAEKVHSTDIYNEVDQDNVITEEQQQKPKPSCQQLPMVTQLFKLLNDPKPIEETPLWYMHKIGTPACYQKPKKIMEIFRNKQLCMVMFEHFYSNTILEWVLKLLQMEDTSTFFELEKVEIMKNLIESIRKQTNIQLKLSKYKNYFSLLSNLQQKMDDKFDKSKYTNLIKIIFTESYPIQFLIDEGIIFITKFMENRQEEFDSIQLEVYQIVVLLVEQYLHFGAKYRANIITDIGISSPNNNKQKNSNMGSGFGMECGNSNSGLDRSMVLQEVVLDVEIEKKIKKLIKLYIENYAVIYSGQNKQNINTKINILQLIKTSVMIQQPNDKQQYIEQILTKPYLIYLFQVLQQNPSCNILHNIVRDLLIFALHKSYSYLVPVLLQETPFPTMVIAMKGKSNAGQKEYQNQLYHVLKIIVKKGEQPINVQVLEHVREDLKLIYEQLQNRMKQKQVLYSTLIGGNPRKQSSCLNDSQEEKIISMNFTNQGSSDKKYPNSGSDPESILNLNSNQLIQQNIEHIIDDELPLESQQMDICIHDRMEEQLRNQEMHQVNQSPEKYKIGEQHCGNVKDNQKRKIGKEKLRYGEDLGEGEENMENRKELSDGESKIQEIRKNQEENKENVQGDEKDNKVDDKEKEEKVEVDDKEKQEKTKIDEKENKEKVEVDDKHQEEKVKVHNKEKQEKAQIDEKENKQKIEIDDKQKEEQAKVDKKEKQEKVEVYDKEKDQQIKVDDKDKDVPLVKQNNLQEKKLNGETTESIKKPDEAVNSVCEQKKQNSAQNSIIAVENNNNSSVIRNNNQQQLKQCNQKNVHSD